jgi:hypothetical protein
MAWAVVSGKVERTFGKGVAVKETFEKRDGTEGAAYYTAWFDEDSGLNVGDTGKFSGFLSAKINEYEKDGETVRRAEIVLNSTRFEVEGPSDDTPF